MKKNIAKYVESEWCLKKYLSYDPESGVFTWLEKPPYSRVNVGEVAGCRATNCIILKLCGRQLYAHQVAWWFMTGKWPEQEIDHKNLDGFDNRFKNLRKATRAQNARNRRAFSRTGMGLKGAFKQKNENRWFGQIVIDGKQIYLGRFATEEEAHAAYVAAAHKHHGEFARSE